MSVQKCHKALFIYQQTHTANKMNRLHILWNTHCHLIHDLENRQFVFFMCSEKINLFSFRMLAQNELFHIVNSHSIIFCVLPVYDTGYWIWKLSVALLKFSLIVSHFTVFYKQFGRIGYCEDLARWEFAKVGINVICEVVLSNWTADDFHILSG